jgi:8-oxo-dGTP diphosphatase
MTTVVAAVIERDGRILICQRRANQPHPLKWEFPGGRVEAAEEPAGALRRELQEELDIDAEIGVEIERYEFEYPARPPITLIFYRVSEYSGAARNCVFERIVWAPAQSLPAFDFLEGDIEFVKRLGRG